MDSGERIHPEPTTQPGSVAFKTLGLILGSAIIGSAATILFMRVSKGGVETFSTTALLGFFFMTVLSVSAAALAIAAISLSRTAERTMNQKSQEISETQVKVATQAEKTVDRLEESVLLVGEEIVEAVCERVAAFGDELRMEFPAQETMLADVREAVATTLASVRVPPADEVVSSEDAGSEADVSEKTEKLPVQEPAVAEEKPPDPKTPECAPEEVLKRADKRYGEFKDIVLRGITNYPGVVVRKVGEGQYRTEGDELVDGAFKINHESVAVCTFATNNVLESRFLGKSSESFSGFLNSLFNELKKRHFTRVFFVFDSVLPETSPYAKALNEFSSQIDAVTFAQFELFEGTPETVIPELTERVSQLMALAAEEESVPELSFRKQMAAGGSTS